MPNRILGHWKCNENAANTVVADVSGNAHTGVASHNTSILSVEDATAFSFTGAAGSRYVSAGDHSDFTFGNGTVDYPFSIAAWVKMVDATYFYLLSKIYSLDAGKFEWIFYLDASDKLVLRLYGSSIGYQIAAVSNDALTSLQGAWHHVAATYSGSKLWTGITLYVDGVAVAASSGNVGIYNAMNNGTAPVELGVGLRGYSGVKWANGYIKDVRMYNFALSVDQLVAIRDDTSGRRFPWKGIGKSHGMNDMSELVGGLAG